MSRIETPASQTRRSTSARTQLSQGLARVRCKRPASSQDRKGLADARATGACTSTPWPRHARAKLDAVDEGFPIAYQVLDSGVPVYASDGIQVGTVDHVVAAPALDIFHGIVLRVETTQRFVAADQVASLHERGVELRIDSTAAAALPEPHGGAPAWRDSEPGVKPSRWSHLVDLVSGKDPHRRDWTEDS
jgi:hypothetical protein